MFDEIPAVFLADFGLPCAAANGHAFTGILDTPDNTMNMAGVNVISTMYTLTVLTADVSAGAMVGGVNVTVNGAVFVVRDVLLQDDGTFTALSLSK